MITTSVAARLAGNDLQQHIFASQSTVIQECNTNGETCLFDWDCCSGFCNWYNSNGAPDGHCRKGDQ
ncbi:hypothetical protein FE391_08325 [Nonomuraea sp. KC401]|uniref:hypothetical protein n=1 Tax=unclassified Nonomuraea TaxID=2593643 RepID=UPI0010FD5935|nr:MULTISPECIES: hypothetical protein [unclassified Nonomuraea]NBE93947.1 hypothetical protein [Nonomuraea sp. K271]TLF80202.1 hypothetical protein FE391_08325 [Nonomuraea sp. KC401]